MKKKILAILAAIILAILPATPVLAIANPDTQQVNSVFAYNSVIEDNDQIYVVEMFTDYAVPPTETLSEAMLANFIDTDGTTVIIGVAPPDPGSATGWGKNLAIIYFSSTDPDLPTWNGAYSIKSAGNPTLGWPGAPPSVTGGVDFWSAAIGKEANQDDLEDRLLDLATELETAWTADIVEQTAAGKKLTTTGAAYFEALFIQMRDAAPDIFAGLTTDPDWTGHDYGHGYADDIEASTTGTAFDMSTLATAIGLPVSWTKAFIWFLATGVIIWIVVGFSRSFKPVMVIVDISFIAGSLPGIAMVPLTLPIGVAFLAALVISFFVYFRPASA